MAGFMTIEGWRFAADETDAFAENSKRGADYTEASIDSEDDPADLALRVSADEAARVPFAVLAELLRRRGFVLTRVSEAGR